MKEIAGCTGTVALSYINNIQFDQTFIGACAFDLTQGVTVINYDDAEFKRALVKQRAKIILPLISSKTPAVSRFTVAGANEITTLVVSSKASIEAIDNFTKAGVHVLFAK